MTDMGLYSGTDLRFHIPQPDVNWHCETTDTALVHHVAVFAVNFCQSTLPTVRWLAMPVLTRPDVV